MTTNNQRKPKRWELYKKEFQIPELRTEEPVGLYPRQSTERQKKKNRQSFEKQTIDAIEEARRDKKTIHHPAKRQRAIQYCGTEKNEKSCPCTDRHG